MAGADRMTIEEVVRKVMLEVPEGRDGLEEILWIGITAAWEDTPDVLAAVREHGVRGKRGADPCAGGVNDVLR